ncbi:MAG: pre-peptidase C-terminal domain-containing protein, partial [Thermoplasmata archaeon]|nr:pre-peptidase C-terminal domain-containing protein [Thermoplasmata archaeon]
GTTSSGHSLSETGDKAYFLVAVGTGFDSLDVATLNAPAGDFDLYVKRGTLPTTSIYDVRGYTNSPNELCTISNPASGTYYIMVYSYSGSGNYDIRATVSGGADVTPPVISSVSVSSITSNSATITWSTNEPASSIVEYGTTTSYGSSKTGTSGVTSHSVALSNLLASKTYHFRVKSTDASVNTATSSDNVFTTTSDGSGTTALTLDGSAGTGTLTASGDKEYFTVSVPAGKTSLKVDMLGPSTADYDLYVRFGAVPTTSTYDSRGYTGTSTESCTITNPTSGTYHIMAISYSGSGSYSVQASSTEAGSSNKWALVIGISNYQSISDLSYCDEDAVDWTNYLQGKGYTVHTLIDSQASEAAIYNEIDNWLLPNEQAGDDVAICFSGHGGFQSEGGYSNTPGQVDGHPSQFFAWDADGSGHGCILDTVLATHLSSLDSTHVFICFDSCRSGGMDEVASHSTSGRYISETCGWDEYGYDAPSHNNGAWTYWYLDWALKSQGYTSCESAFVAAAPQYHSEHPDSNPEEEDNYSGSFVF